MAITIFLEISVAARREPTMTPFVFLSNVSDKIFGRPFLLKVWLSSLFFSYVFHEFIDVCLSVNFEYCFENFSRTSLVLWFKAYLPISIQICFGML